MYTITSIKQARSFVIIAGLLWSAGGPLIRLLEGASEWQFLFYRSIGLTTAMFLLIRIKSPNTITQFKKAGIASVIGGLFLSLAFVTFVFSVTHTTIANALFIGPGAAPFIAGLLGWILLRERIDKTQWTAMTAAAIGILLMIQDGLSGDILFGNLTAFAAAVGFAGFTVSLRWGRNENMLPTVFYAGLFTVFFSAFAAVFLNDGLSISRNDLFIATGFGAFGLGFGMVLYVAGSYKMQAAELVLLSLLEIILGPIWAWMFFSELPTSLTMIGGAILLSAILFQTFSGMGIFQKKLQTVTVKTMQ